MQNPKQIETDQTVSNSFRSQQQCLKLGIPQIAKLLLLKIFHRWPFPTKINILCNVCQPIPNLYQFRSYFVISRIFQFSTCYSNSPLCQSPISREQEMIVNLGDDYNQAHALLHAISWQVWLRSAEKWSGHGCPAQVTPYATEW